MSTGWYDRVNRDDIKNPGSALSDVRKVGYTLPISFERLVVGERKGHYEPVGVKWVQWHSWALGFVVFKLWIGTENILRKFRHYEGVSGYEWEEAEYHPFKQKERWVEDE